MIKQLITLIALLVAPPMLAQSAPIYSDALYQQQRIEGLAPLADSINFAVIGDWGHNGHFYQRPVAHQLEIALYQLDGDFVISTGDNFYPDGVASTQDPLWQSAFERIYHGPHSFVPWHSVLGNHDYLGNAQAQIDYSNVSGRWQMPARYYSQRFTLASGEPVLVLFLDTNTLVSDYRTRAKYRATQGQDPGPQLAWLKRQLSGSDAAWTLVVGHHPIYTSGKRYGRDNGLVETLAPLLKRYGVDAYIAGHEHDLQHNQIKHSDLAHYVSGGGSEARSVEQREFTRYAEATPGFLTFSINADALQMSAVNHRGEVRYQHKQLRRNKEHKHDQQK